jgi:hypothetical protein
MNGAAKKSNSNGGISHSGAVNRYRKFFKIFCSLKGALARDLRPRLVYTSLFFIVLTSIVDLDPDPYVFGPSGSVIIL